MTVAPDSDLSPLRLVSRRRLADDIHEFVLARDDGADLPPFTPGSHLRLRTPNGLVRCYSLCNAPSERTRYVVAVKRDAGGRGGSMSLIDEAKVGDEIAVSEPRDAFRFEAKPGGALFIAGGIGVTPLLSMARHLIETDGGPFRFVYLTRSRETTAYAEEMAGEGFRGRVTIHHDGGDPARAFDLWPLLERPKGQVYCCGPRFLMDAVRDMTGHWSTAAVHFEDFGGVSAVPRPDDVAFDVRLARSNRVVPVAADVTILDALRAAGIHVSSSCESGTCGSCRVGLLAGEADHRDMALNDDEKPSAIMVCVSRSRGGELVLDL